MQNKPSYYSITPGNVRYDKDLSPNAKHLYGEITALCNAEGYCWANNNYFAELYNVTKRSVQAWISQLAKKGYIHVELTPNENSNEPNRKIYINFMGEENFITLRRNLHGGDEEKFTTPHEEIFTHNNTSINTTINNTRNINNIEQNSNSAQIEKEFEKIWKAYPRKLGKKKAFDAYKKARKIKKISYETIEKGLYKYIEYLEQQQTEERFIMHGSTWFTQEKWQDEYVSTAPRRKPRNAFEYYQMEYGGISHEPTRNGEIINNYSTVIPESF